MLAAILTICGTAAFASCATNDDNPSGQAVESRYVPLAPDYSDPTMWITEDGDADGTGADVMITEITEAPWYVQNDPRLAAPLLNAPFTHGEIGVLMRKGQDDLLTLVNAVIAQMKADGTLRQLHEKYGLVYSYE